MMSGVKRSDGRAHLDQCWHLRWPARGSGTHSILRNESLAGLCAYGYHRSLHFPWVGDHVDVCVNANDCVCDHVLCGFGLLLNLYGENAFRPDSETDCDFG